VSTTNLFVELVVIGMGSALWACLLCCTVCGYGWLNSVPLSPVLVLPGLVVVYVLGIVFDRVSDWLFGVWDDHLRVSIHGSVANYRRARILLYAEGSKAACALFDYNKSRIRIARAWSLDLFLCAVTAPVFVSRQLDSIQTGKRIAVGTSLFLAFLVVAFLTLWAWYRLVSNDYERLRETGDYLEAHKCQENRATLPIYNRERDEPGKDE